MPFDPNQPAFGSPDSSAVMRSQLTALHDLIVAQAATIATLTNQIQSLNNQMVSMGNSLGTAQGNISILQSELLSVAANAANNPVGISQLGGTVSDPPTQAEVSDAVNKINEMLTVMSHA